MQKRWKFLNIPEKEKQLLCQDLQIHPVLCGILAQRGIHSYDAAKKFFRPSLEDGHDPYLMKDMQLAVDRIVNAMKNDESILVYGDYDVDGTASVALLYDFLK